MEIHSLKKFLNTGIITPERMRAVDKNAVSLGVTALQLMASAGKSLSDCVKKDDPSFGLIWKSLGISWKKRSILSVP